MKTTAARLHSLLKPLEAIEIKLEATLQHARQNNLPRSFTDTIKSTLRRLEGAWDELLETSTALDPALRETEL